MQQRRQRCLVNGEARSDLDVSDRGLAYGDGLFETIAVRSGRPCCWLEHLDRLALGAARLRLSLPSPSQLQTECSQLVAGVGDGTLKMIITRGPSARGYPLPSQPRPTRILFVDERDAGPVDVDSDTHRGMRATQGVRVRLCDTRLGINSQLAGLKHLNRLEQVLARSEWTEPSIDEGLMLDSEGALVCGIMSNLFLLTNLGLETPLIDRCGVAGTARACLLRIAGEAGHRVRERRLTVEDLIRSKGALLTNALLGVLPIRSFEDRGFDLSLLPWSLIEQVRSRLFQPESDW